MGLIMHEREIAYLLGELKEGLETLKEQYTAMDIKMDAMKDELSIYKNIYKGLKFTGGAILLILTMKLGEIKTLWTHIFHGY